tara:strand:+ start:343 stop:477 length:135 start_codon:yes stop_codon:yes gene_type:complete
LHINAGNAELKIVWKISDTEAKININRRLSKKLVRKIPRNPITR